jgi:uncharacterized protein (TIGR03083 family)
MKIAGFLDAYHAQCEALADWLDGLDPDDFAHPSVLPGWDVRTLAGHLVLIDARLRSTDKHVPPNPEDLAASLRGAAAQPVAGSGIDDRSTVSTSRGPAVTALDRVRTRVIEVVVHCDDLSRSLSEREPVPLVRPALAIATRTLAETLASEAPGHAVELRVSPFVAVQAVAGPRHTRGTPPNVVETDPLTWLRLAAGRISFAAALADGSVRASGTRADLTPYLPVLRAVSGAGL